MTVLRESPWYQEILKEGRIEGTTEGLLKGKSDLVLRQIRRRFGKLEPIFSNQIRGLSLEKLEELGESLFDFSSLRDLISWLENHP